MSTSALSSNTTSPAQYGGDALVTPSRTQPDKVPNETLPPPSMAVAAHQSDFAHSVHGNRQEPSGAAQIEGFLDKVCDDLNMTDPHREAFFNLFLMMRPEVAASLGGLDELARALLTALDRECGTGYSSHPEPGPELSAQPPRQTGPSNPLKLLMGLAAMGLLMPGANASLPWFGKAPFDASKTYPNRHLWLDLQHCRSHPHLVQCEIPSDPLKVPGVVQLRQGTVLSPNTHYLWVHLPDDTLLVMPERIGQAPRIGHTEMSKGGPVKGSGNLVTDSDGRVEGINNMGGHHGTGPSESYVQYATPPHCRLTKNHDNACLKFKNEALRQGVSLARDVFIDPVDMNVPREEAGGRTLLEEDLIFCQQNVKARYDLRNDPSPDAQLRRVLEAGAGHPRSEPAHEDT